MPRTTIGMREVARRAEVSLSTVSLALNGTGYVSPDILKKVEVAAKECGYKIPQKKSRTTIAVILPAITSSFFSNVLSGIENTVAEKDHPILFGNSGFDFAKELQFIKTVRKQALCGLIIDTICPAERESDYFKMLKKTFVDRQVPVVFLERQIGGSDFFSVSVDHYRNAYMATEHLIKQKHTCIAHISGGSGNPITAERIRGYRAALESNNLTYDESLISEGDFSPNSGYLAMKKLMAKRSDFTAVFCANDQMAIGAVKAIKSYGKVIPDDIAVIGIDNIAISSIVTPALSTINVPTYQLGHMAAKVILDIHGGRSYEKIHQLASNLIIRQSTNPFANSEWELFGW